jgi:cyclic pyranopterin phosphate synthase
MVPTQGRDMDRRATETTPIESPAGYVPEAAASVTGLTDPQGRIIDYVRLSVTDRCNYRCTYCMPESGIDHVDRADILSFEEIVGIVRCFASLGVRRLRITGGEPTVRRDLVDLARRLRSIPGIEELALSTNGHLLAELAAPLRAAGVTRLNVSIDTLDPTKFARITRRGDLARVRAGVDAACAVGFSVIKINTVAVKGFNDGEVGALCDYAWTRGLVPRFIEQMPMAGGEMYIPGELLTAREIRDLVLAADPGASLSADEGGAARGAGPARYWRLARPGETTLRRVGIISPMTEHFCDACNRVRLSSSGALHACLGYDDAVNLRDLWRHGGARAVIAAVHGAVAGKRSGHAFGLLGIGGPRKSMISIGG